MNRRRFLELFGMAAVGTVVVYSFPDIIIPKNIIIPSEDILHLSIKVDNPKILTEIYPQLIDDNFFIEDAHLAYMRKTYFLASDGIYQMGV